MDGSQPSWVLRGVWSAVIALHLFAMANSALAEVWGEGLRPWTKPYERVLGVHQNWPMFVGVPQRTRWLSFEGVTPDGDRVPLPDLHGDPSAGGVIWRYSRRNKFERNAVVQRREYLRTALVRWQCRVAVAEGRALAKVIVNRHVRATPAPAGAVPPRAEWPVQVEEVGAWNCPR